MKDEHRDTTSIQGTARRSAFSRPRNKNTACYRSKEKEETKMPYNSKALGMVISILRIERGLTQEQLSGLAGIARSHLAALESGQKVPRADTLWKLSDALSVRASELIRMTEKAMSEEKRGK